jgi:hypothetical protein
MRRRLIPAIGLLISILASGCSSDGAVDGSSAAVTGGFRKELTGRETDQLYLAEQHLIRSCMQVKGFSYTVVQPTHASTKPDRAGDVTWARQHGYGLADVGSTAGASSDGTRPNGQYIAGLSAQRRLAFQRALDGTRRDAIQVEIPALGTIYTSADGCQAQAREELYGDMKAWTRAKAIMVNLRAITFKEVTADSRYAQAMDAWIACMARKGLDFENHGQAVESLADRFRKSGGSAAVRAAERRTAVADAECNKQSRLAWTQARVEREHIDMALQRPYRSEAAHYTTAVTRGLAQAREILGNQ